jgi:hypothetical protein
MARMDEDLILAILSIDVRIVLSSYTRRRRQDLL